ncbi:MAG TPA: hypothetical protein VNR60_02150 [Croceibacterium sp.]|nr:hypothetical protein [Croceibacterium sp.]
MTAHRASILAAGAAALFLSGPAIAQVEDGIVLNIMRECARIDDPTARLACYDNNIRSAGASPRVSTPGRMDTPQASAGAPVSRNSPSGFGGDSVRTTQRFETPAGQVDEISATITAISQRGPGLYLLTIDGGAQWQFAESVGNSYRVPRVGSTVEIARGSLGSFLMRFDRQQGVPVRRVR